MNFDHRLTSKRRRPLRRTAVSLLTATVVLAVLAAAASATTVRGSSGQGFVVSGEPGQVNHIRADFANNAIRVQDFRAGISATDCFRRGSRDVSCFYGAGLSIAVGERDDRVTVNLGCCAVKVDAGSGNDRIQLRPARSRTTTVSVALRDGQRDRVRCGNSKRVRLVLVSRDSRDAIDDCPARR
jgi:hypothetical protein